MRQASSVGTPEGLRSPVGDQSLTAPLPGAQRSRGEASRRDAITDGFWWSLPAARLPPRRHICLLLKKADAGHPEGQPASIIRGPNRNPTPDKRRAWSSASAAMTEPFVRRRYAGDGEHAPHPSDRNQPAFGWALRRGAPRS